MNENDKVYTIEEVAESLQVHSETVKKWVQEGKLGAVKIGYRTIRILQSDIDKFIKDRHEDSAYMAREGKTTR